MSASWFDCVLVVDGKIHFHAPSEHWLYYYFILFQIPYIFVSYFASFSKKNHFLYIFLLYLFFLFPLVILIHDAWMHAYYIRMDS